jgi:hypothetical protein
MPLRTAAMAMAALPNRLTAPYVVTRSRPYLGMTYSAPIMTYSAQ